MSSENGNNEETKSNDFPGSRWWKFDFHAHTPASHDFREQRDITAKEWLEYTMKAELDCVAVTDHNSGEWIEKLKTANMGMKKEIDKPEWYRELVIFPGIEITLDESSTRKHLLAIFDPAKSKSEITAILGACGISGGFGDHIKTHTSMSFTDLVKIIHGREGVAIPAHVKQRHGLLENVKTLQESIKESLNSVDALEVLTEKAFDDSDFELRKILKNLAHVSGSDAHLLGDIGKHISWVKMSKPSIEGLRLALIDKDLCIKPETSGNPNKIPRSFIKSISIKNMKHCGKIEGRPFRIDFHPHLNTLIGGRGTGKSTVIEAIRVSSDQLNSLRDQSPEIYKKLERFISHVKEGVFLDKTEIKLEILRNNTEYQISWSQEEFRVSKKEDEEWKEEERSGKISERFPISIYSQKQIYELSANQRGLLEIIDQSERVNKSEWQERWKKKESEYMSLCFRKRDLSHTLSQKDAVEARLKDINTDLQSYEQKGYKEILQLYQRRIQQNNNLSYSSQFEEKATKLREIAEDIELSDFPEYLFGKDDKTMDELKHLYESINKELKELGKEIISSSDRIEKLKEIWVTGLYDSRWHGSFQEISKTYEEMEDQYNDRNSRITLQTYKDWIGKRNILISELKDFSEAGIQLQEVNEQLRMKLASLTELLNELYEKRKKFIEEILTENKYVKMELIHFGDISNIEQEYRNILNLGDNRFSGSVLESDNEKGILWEIYRTLDLDITKANYLDLIKDIKEKTLAIAEGKNTEFDRKFCVRLQKELQDNPEKFDKLQLWFPEDLLQVKYSQEQGGKKFTNLDKGSAGQKSAAILAFLLSYGKEPLIIDQPEDDLDNALIYDLIVQQIAENKLRRQLIIVSHNANIVVNGDSELVSVLNYKNGQVVLEKQGGLEENEIRDLICKIMEGGKRAFRLRYKRISGANE